MAYPFEFLRSRHWRTKTNKAYILHPFRGEGNDFAQDVVVPAVGRAGLIDSTARSAHGSSEISPHILAGIAEADVVIAVLVDRNPNVYWEIGVAMTWKPPTSILTIGRAGIEDESIPFNVQGYRHLFIDTIDKTASITSVAEEILALKNSHDSALYESVISAHNSLGQAELYVAFERGPGSGNFVIPKPRPDATGITSADFLVNGFEEAALGNLCRLGLISLSTAPGKPIGTEFSYYWTPLGNAVLKQLNLIDSDEVARRLDRLSREVPAIRDWRGGYIFPPILES